MYSKIHNFGPYIEIKTYEKAPHKSTKAKNRSNKGRSKYLKRRYDCTTVRRFAFKRLVVHALHRLGKPAFITCTFAYEPRAHHVFSEYSRFGKSLRQIFGKQIVYIAVKEKGNKGRMHVHSLVWGLPDHVVQQEYARNNRTLQNIWLNGWLDCTPAYDSSPRIASYMAKYFAKGFQDYGLDYKEKAYISSNNCPRPSTFSTQTFTESDIVLYLGLSQTDLDRTYHYETELLGTCKVKQYRYDLSVTTNKK
jgi:hypothetical protein